MRPKQRVRVDGRKVQTRPSVPLRFHIWLSWPQPPSSSGTLSFERINETHLNTDFPEPAYRLSLAVLERSCRKRTFSIKPGERITFTFPVIKIGISLNKPDTCVCFQRFACSVVIWRWIDSCEPLKQFLTICITLSIFDDLSQASHAAYYNVAVKNTNNT